LQIAELLHYLNSNAQSSISIVNRQSQSPIANRQSQSPIVNLNRQSSITQSAFINPKSAI